MICNMHCRPPHPTTGSNYFSPFLFAHSDCTNTVKASSRNQILPPSPTPRRRRRLEDPVITYASNYYISHPRQTSRSPSPQCPPLPFPRQIDQQSEDKDIFCDLCNLLERPLLSPPAKTHRKKYTLNENTSGRRHRSVDYKNAHAKMKDSKERKRHYHPHHQQQRQQPSYYREKRHQKDKSLPMHHFDRLPEESKTNNSLYQRHSLHKGFFRRVARNYFCIPMTGTNGELSN